MLQTIVMWSILTIIIIHCEELRATPMYQVSLIQDNQCPSWFYYDNATNECECLSGLFTNFKSSRTAPITCAYHRNLLDYNFCMSYDEETSTVSVSYCTYCTYNHNISVPGFINLPSNISALNNYLCAPMNRKGIVCSECIDGYGPSVTSPKFRCSDCTNAWYGIPLYLLLELVPVTVFYLIVLIFQVNFTSAPMISFILYSNIVIVGINMNTVNQDQSQVWGSVVATLYSIWSLDFFRYAIPPFCISPHLKIIHILYLQSVSSIFSLLLVLVTWICITLYSRDYKIVTWPLKLLKRTIFKHSNKKWNVRRTVVDAFATFFLLSFSKLSFMLQLQLIPLVRYNLNSLDHSANISIHPFTDPSVDFISKEHLPFVAISTAVFLFINLPPVILLALYPVQAFRSLLFKCLPKRSIAPFNIFVEKFYSCYRDGLNGGRDMRGLASLYFFIILLASFLWSIESGYFTTATLFGGCSLFIANVQPYKKKHMSVIDSLILANSAFLFIMIDQSLYASSFLQIVIRISALLPLLGLVCIITYKLLEKQLKIASVLIKQKLLQAKAQFLVVCCSGHKGDNARDEEQGSRDSDHNEAQLPDRIVHPEIYYT